MTRSCGEGRQVNRLRRCLLDPEPNCAPLSHTQDLRRAADDQLRELRILPRPPGAARAFLRGRLAFAGGARFHNHMCAPPPTLRPLTGINRAAAGLISLHRGQGLELLWRDSLACPTED